MRTILYSPAAHSHLSEKGIQLLLCKSVPILMPRQEICMFEGVPSNPWRVPILLVNRCCSYKVFQISFFQHLLHPISPARNHKTRASDFWVASNFSGLLNSCSRFQGALAKWVNLIPLQQSLWAHIVRALFKTRAFHIFIWPHFPLWWKGLGLNNFSINC